MRGQDGFDYLDFDASLSNTQFTTCAYETDSEGELDNEDRKEHIESRIIEQGNHVTRDETMRSSKAIDDLGSLIWKLDLVESGEPIFTGPSGNFCFTDSSLVPRLAKEEETHQPSSSNEDELWLPALSQDTALKQHLAKLFVEKVNPYHQFIEIESLDSINAFPTEEVERSILYSAIFAAGAYFSNTPNAKRIQTACTNYAESISMMACRTKPSLHVIQALSIMSWLELNEERDTTAWVYLCKHTSLTGDILAA